MGIPNTNAEFISLIVQSNLIDSATLDQYLKSGNVATLTPDDPAEMAGAMIRDGLLTHFQAEQLIQGKWKGFFIGRYKVLGVLGAGGMGKVFLCEHGAMRRQVAIKVLPPKMASDPTVVERFYNEAEAIARLDHRNIVHAYDVAHDGGVHFLVMEYVKGMNLEELVTREGPLSPYHALDYLRQASLGLLHAYEAGLVHRDIKPSNFIIAENGVLKILDLGLARFFHDKGSKPSNDRNEPTMGTVDYMAPEQALNSGSVDSRADIYSLGATFYYCLSGRSPFEGGTTAQKLLWHQIRDPEPLANLRPDLPPQLTDLITRMMAKAPEDRFQTPAELLSAIPTLEPVVLVPNQPESAIDTLPIHAGPSPTVTLKDRQSKGSKGPGWRPSTGLVAGVFVALALAAVGIYIAMSGDSGTERKAPDPTPNPPAPNTKPGKASPEPQPQPIVPKPVFLMNLTAEDVIVGVGQMGRGTMGFDGQPINVNGVNSPHGLAMHAVLNGNAHVRYELGGRYKLFTGSVGMSDTSGEKAATAVTFVIKGDGKDLWKSKPVQRKADKQDFSVDVTGVHRLELDIVCPGKHDGVHSVWIEPALTPR